MEQQNKVFLLDLKYHEFRFKLWYKEEESLIALILDGNSEVGGHVCIKICLRHLFGSKGVSNLKYSF